MQSWRCAQRAQSLRDKVADAEQGTLKRLAWTTLLQCEQVKISGESDGKHLANRLVEDFRSQSLSSLQTRSVQGKRQHALL